jgi:hypothetical protein
MTRRSQRSPDGSLKRIVIGAPSNGSTLKDAIKAWLEAIGKPSGFSAFTNEAD